MNMDDAIKTLKAEYERVRSLSFIRNPVAYALYQVWKKADAKGGKNNG